MRSVRRENIILVDGASFWIVVKIFRRLAIVSILGRWWAGIFGSRLDFFVKSFVPMWRVMQSGRCRAYGVIASIMSSEVNPGCARTRTK